METSSTIIFTNFQNYFKYVTKLCRKIQISLLPEIQNRTAEDRQLENYTGMW